MVSGLGWYSTPLWIEMNMVWPNWLDSVLAKSADKSIQNKPETLSQHTWNVLQRFSDLVSLRPDLPMAVGESHLWHYLFWACWLHDFGKSAQSFQDVLSGKLAKWPQRHEVLSLAFVDWLFPANESPGRLWVISAIASHHKDASYMAVYPDDLEVEDDVIPLLLNDISDSSILGLWDWLDICQHSWIQALSLNACGVNPVVLPPRQIALSNFRSRGAQSIHRGLREYQALENAMSNDTKHPMRQIAILIRGHIVSADHMASAHVDEPPKSRLDDPERLIERLNLAHLYGHQLDSLAVRGSAVLMAPTGSGKTEAALLWAVSQAESNRPVPRLYYTLPFQASMNAMEQRLGKNEKDRKAPFSDQVGLEHSRSTLAYYRRFLEEDYSPENALKAARWSNNLARLNYYPVRVLSPYQLLKAPYRLKGYETLLTDCFGAAFVFDEIHAYEADRLAKILATVKYLREQYGARFFVMSATLPVLLRDRLTDALGNYRLLQASPELYAQFRRHVLILKDGDMLSDQALDRIAQVAKGGQSVLVCCNTVNRAQMVCESLKERLKGCVEVLLLHGRFSGKDRLTKEVTVRDATGSRSEQRRPIVLVATQVVEVSLDIDLDVIYTDPAPLEALLQRFGRVNRRRLKEAAPVCVFRDPVPDDWRPYDPALIKASLAVLEKHKDQIIDEAEISKWLDEVYGNPEIATAWNKEYQSAYTEFCEITLATLRAFQSNPQLEEVFYQAFDSVEVLPFGLSKQYETALEDNHPLEASQLLVPLRWRQYMMLKNQGRVRESDDHHLREVDAYYDSDTGLDLTRRYKEWGDDLND